MKKKILPPTYFCILLVLSVIFHFIVPVLKLIPGPYNYVGIVLIGLGIWIDIWADALFKKIETTVKPHEMPSFLETSGPFRISRHPMYLGMAGVLFGVAVVLGSLITFAFPVLFIIIMEALFIPVEEKNVEKAFGKRFLEYKKRVRRWI